MKYDWKITNKKTMKDQHKSLIATVLGLLTSVFTAMAIIDFSTFCFTCPGDLMRLAVVIMPAIGGYFSTLK